MIRKMKVMLTEAVTKASWDSLVSTISDGAIDYWALCKRLSDTKLEVREMDEGGDCVAIHMFGIDDMADGIETLLGGSVQVREDIRSAIYTYIVGDEEEPAFDQEQTDVIVQVALFGAIIYG